MIRKWIEPCYIYHFGVLNFKGLIKKENGMIGMELRMGVGDKYVRGAICWKIEG